MNLYSIKLVTILLTFKFSLSLWYFDLSLSKGLEVLNAVIFLTNLEEFGYISLRGWISVFDFKLSLLASCIANAGVPQVSDLRL